MRKRKCPEPECYRGTFWNDQGEEQICPRCGGAGLVNDLEAELARFKDAANIAAAEGFLKALRENPFDEDLHLVFADWLEERGEDDEASYHRTWTPERQQAEDFLDDYAAQCWISQEELIQAGHDYLDKGNSFCIGVDTPGVVFQNHEDFWRHFETLTGRSVPVEQRVVFIRCAC